LSDSPHILLIDGNRDEREYYAHRLQLSSPDCIIAQAATGHAGLALCQEHPPDCVVLELELPDMSGFEVLLRLVPRPYRPELPVIILTRLYNLQLLKAAITNGAQAALFKSMVSGDVLEKTLFKAMAAVRRDSKRVQRRGSPTTAPRPVLSKGSR
jgi:CheY-like chemotaxis protein